MYPKLWPTLRQKNYQKNSLFAALQPRGREEELIRIIELLLHNLFFLPFFPRGDGISTVKKRWEIKREESRTLYRPPHRKLYEARSLLYRSQILQQICVGKLSPTSTHCTPLHRSFSSIFCSIIFKITEIIANL